MKRLGDWNLQERTGGLNVCLGGRKKDHQWVKDSYLATSIQDLDFAVTNKINGVRWGQNVIICFCGQKCAYW